ncbi:7-cyano-7-deazaguanine/7-aminomethyl-7-deazaguanine transporter [Gelidibacter japonicus]|uniref:7-cyano-7-deazaguanine/7-aminomethyl-7- deazaguanine transporter n=1 Tax=Gelidibacter japonicus TaxID=1962232 RepID=UPI0013D6F77C|nr:7-cyano-7-deazaguanine/7-aminomethyl-7-deazaguanine transporter [Gelidibacter japonicus]MCL8007825.1 7-cyano-7-deazaguanine/7-aminomethyl-7-deazaguanine transporter [Gelidibacter japonicus]
MSSIKNTRLVLLLVGFHILIIASSNYLVQFPISIFGFKATWGAFTFPFIFLATDLTVRLFGARMGRRIIFYAMFPALLVSYLITVGFRHGIWLGFDAFFGFDLFVARIAIASFAAYVVGQILDIFVFNKLRQHKQWWHAPLASGIFGNFMDTLTFFFIAFYKTSDPYLAENLVEIATVDYIFKIIINALFFLPLYKVILDRVTKRLKDQNLRNGPIP